MTFCTPECAKAIDDYLDYRRRCGEKLTPESPFIREQFDRSDPFRSVRVRHVAQSTIMNTIKQILLTRGSGSVYLRQRLLKKWKKMSRTIPSFRIALVMEKSIC
jgi:hypothetical protein